MQGLKSLVTEFQRRHVVRAGVAHVIVFWLLIQVADVVLPYLGIVEESVRWVLLAGIALFPVTLIVAWFFEHPWHRFTRGRVIVDLFIIVVIAITASAWVIRNIPQVVHARTSIVILPFEHSGDPLEQGLSRALAYEVSSLLLKSRSIDVIGFESATSSVLEGLDVATVAQRLDVKHVVAGTIAAADNAMRIDVRLLDHAGKLIWNIIIEESLENLFAVQERIATDIELRLGFGDATVPVEELATNRCWMPNDPESLQKYYTARYYGELRTESETSRQQLRDAIRYYEELIATHPEFAEAYSGLAWALTHQLSFDTENAPADWRERGTDLAREAVRFCPTLTEAIHWLPNEYDHENFWIGNYQQLTAFIEMEPQRAENYQRLTFHYRETGLTKKAIEIAEQNYAMDPLSPRAIKNLSGIYQYAERYDEAIELADLAAELGNTGPNFARATKGMSECNRDIQCVLGFMPPPYQQFEAAFEKIYAVPSNAGEARASIDLALELNARNPDMLLNWFTASVCGVDHLTSLFFELWEQNKELDKFWFWANAWMPGCNNVWSDPRFPGLVEEVGFVDYWRVAGWPAMCMPDGDSVMCGDAALEKRR